MDIITDFPEYLNKVLYNPDSQNIGKANNILNKAAQIILPSIPKNLSNLRKNAIQSEMKHNAISLIIAKIRFAYLGKFIREFDNS